MDRNEFIERLFARAKERAGDAPDFACEASYGESDSFEATVRGGEILQYNVAGGGGLGFRALVNGRMGYASTESLSKEQAAAIVERAADNASVLESEEPVFLGAGGKTYTPPETEPYPLPSTEELIRCVLKRPLFAYSTRKGKSRMQ